MQVFNVVPNLPEELAPLKELAYNLWHAWNPEALTLFMRVDRELWEKCNHNPVLMLGRVEQDRLNKLAKDDGFLIHLKRVSDEFHRYVEYRRFFQFALGVEKEFRVAYFSAEFGVNDSIPNYSGGLGVLAGDHVKSASDLNVPLVGMGLMYQQGYFRQYLTSDGWQQELYPENDFHNMPLKLMRNPENNEPLTVYVPMKDRQVATRIWKLSVGRVSIYLLDTNNTLNSDADRAITDQLYGGDIEHRLQQEIILGIGGVRALKELGIEPAVYHLNEGHSAFVMLERLRNLLGENLNMEEASLLVRSTTVFTTHTPVPAGNDVFPSDLIRSYLTQFVKEVGFGIDEFLGFGRVHPEDKSEGFCMTVLALKNSAFANGVSELHGKVSRKMWKALYPTVEMDEVPIDHVTNGVHIPSWISIEMAMLYFRYLGPKWVEDPDNEKIWDKVSSIPDAELWRTHERRRERLVAFTRKRLIKSLNRRGARQHEIRNAREVLDPEALTIGFARRFATYKRGDLIFRDVERLATILNDPKRPVQLIFAGKAHPRDMAGKDIIKRIVHFTKDKRFVRRVVFLEDYDINVARYLVQGVDVWLNNPRRPLEASGTSGMKAAANGALNMSVLDGWWCEAYNGINGWAIGAGEEYEDKEYQDEVESRAILDLLENEVIPTFYKRTSDNLPREWVSRMKNNLTTVCSFFSTHRMVEDYMENYYLAAAEKFGAFRENDHEPLKLLNQWLRKVEACWEKVKIVSTEFPAGRENPIGVPIQTKVMVNLGGLNPKDIQVEAYFGKMNAAGNFEFVETAILHNGQQKSSELHEFSGNLVLDETGKFGIRFRIRPVHPLLEPILTVRDLKWDE